MTDIFESKKFRMKVFKTGSYQFKVKEPYLTDNDFTSREITNFMNKFH